MKVHRERFTELAVHRGGERVLNIIFVHGLRGHPRSTWEDAKHRGFGPKVFWPEQFLAPDLPQARIWTYGYNADVVGFFAANNKNSVLQHGEDLAIRLENDINNKDPIVFLGHSLGGIIVKHAMHESKECRDRTKLIIFLGTPHRGSEFADWARIATNVMNTTLDSNQELVDNLEVNSVVLDNINEKFLRIVCEDKINIYSFYEARGISGFKLFSGKVVNDISSRLNLPKPFETVESLDANHMQMARCTSRNNPNYRAILHVLERFIQVPATMEVPDSHCVNILSKNLEHEGISRQRPWVVPFGRNESFVGRESILRQILKRIPPNVNKDDCQRTAIEGLGGVGKTQLALEAVFRVRDEYPDCSVFWVPAVDMGNFENAYREIGRELKIDRIDEDAVNIKELVKAALSQDYTGMWLLVIDNADDTDLLFGRQRLVDYLPFSKMGSVLFTTRNHEAVVRLDIPKSGVIKMEEMSQSEALELLQKSLMEDQMSNDENTTKLLDFLSNLPLAIRQASAYMAKTGMSIKRYLEHCQGSDERLIRLLSKDFEDRARYKDSGNAVATTWLISFKHIARDSETAARHLEFICFFGEKDIPESLLPPVDDELEAEEAMGTLKAYTFVTQREERNSFDVHRLVRLAMQNWLDREGKKDRLLAQVVEWMATIFPHPEHEKRDVWMRYIPHGQIVLDFCGKSVDVVDRIVLLSIVGGSLHVLARYQEAEHMYQSAVTIGEKALGREDSLTLSNMHNLAAVLKDQGRCEEAEHLNWQTLELRQKTLGIEHLSTLNTMDNLVSVFRVQGKFEEAEKMNWEIFKLKEKVLGKEHPSTCESMNDHAILLISKGSFAEGYYLCRLVFELRTKVLGEGHPLILESLNHFATAHIRNGDYDEAEKIARYTVEIQERTLGREHPYTLESIGNLAVALNNQGKYMEAKTLYRQILKVQENLFGRHHTMTVTYMICLATTLSSQEEYVEAEQILWRALELASIRKQLRCRVLASLGSAIFGQGRYEEAETTWREAFELAKKVLGEEHPLTFKYRRQLENCLTTKLETMGLLYDGKAIFETPNGIEIYDVYIAKPKGPLESTQPKVSPEICERKN